MPSHSLYSFFKYDTRQLLTEIKGISFEVLHSSRHTQLTAEAALAERTLADACHRLGESDFLQTALVESIVVDGGQPCEMAQLLKRGDGIVSTEHASQRLDGGSLIGAQLAVLVAVPVLYAQSLHLAVGKGDVGGMYQGHAAAGDSENKDSFVHHHKTTFGVKYSSKNFESKAKLPAPS